MTYKEFDEWCTERLFDDYLTTNELTTCFDVLQRIHRIPPSKQEMFWQNCLDKDYIIKQIVKPTNKKISIALKNKT